MADVYTHWRRGWSKKRLWSIFYQYTPLHKRTPLRRWVVPQCMRHKLSPKPSMGVKAIRKNFDVGSW